MLEFAMEYLPVLIVGAIIGTFALVFIFAYLALRRRKEEGEDNDRHMADGEIIRRLLHLGITRFRALFKGSRSRSEVVATFLAVLELCKARRLRLAGTEEDCTITCTQSEEDGPVEFTTDAY